MILGDGLDELRRKAQEATKVVPDWHVSNDHWLQHVLERLWPSFVTLRKEIFAEAGKSDGEASARYDQWKLRLAELNPAASDMEIETEAKRLSGLDKLPIDRVSSRYWGRVMPLYTEVAILTAALCEAEINLALAWGLSMIDKEDTFQLIESRTTVDKWLHGPKLILPNYNLPLDTAEAATLVKVFKERNRLVHPKSTVQKSGKTKLTGPVFKPTTLSELLAWIGRYFSLPFDLADFLHAQSPVNGYRFPFMAQRGAIKRAPQHKLARNARV